LASIRVDGLAVCYHEYRGKEAVKNTWGGAWTEQKLDAFEKYVNAYLKIMNRYRDMYNWKLIYFDAFAGSGSRDAIKDEKDKSIVFSEFEINEEEKSVYKGSAERVVKLSSTRGFDYYYFIESDEKSKKELEERLNPLNPDKKLKFIFRCTDANEQLEKLAKLMQDDKKYRTLAMLDPFGMQVKWSSIEKLVGTKIDLWILIPSGVIINRLLDGHGKLTHIDKLVEHLGLPEENIRDYFYNTSVEQSLFGEERQYQKKSESIKKIAEIYIGRLKGIFKFAIETPLILQNSRNVPIYHFAFASDNETAKRIADGIIGREQR
jgi:three-Cys-motif partner protein